ncbi:MAG: hypothetical protein JW720_14880 [Sedimentisphaerales bacterium]|nr:hypothetical protein [Sedimentisphaerales bacterium]
MLTNRSHKTSAASENEVASEKTYSRAKGRMAVALQRRKTASLPRIRLEKILAIRRQLIEGKYDVAWRLGAILEVLYVWLAVEDEVTAVDGQRQFVGSGVVRPKRRRLVRVSDDPCRG